MNIQWTDKGLSDVARIYDFLSPMDKEAAARVVQSLAGAPDALLSMPRMGEQLFEFSPREVRRILIGHYELRYELQDENINILRVWHTRETR